MRNKQPDAPLWFARALGSPTTDNSVRVGGVRVAFRLWGDVGGPGVILVHGGGVHARWWGHIALLLVKQRRRVAVIDLSGHGDSGSRGRYGLDSWASEVLTVAEASELGPRPVVIGHSMGGMVAMQTSALAGPQLGGVVVVDSLLHEPALEDPVVRDRPRPPTMRTYASRDAILARFRPVPDQPVLNYVSRHVAEHSVRQTSSERTRKFDAALYKNVRDLRPHVLAIRLRIALVRGEHSLLSAEITERVRTQIPAAGHHITRDQPLAMTAELRMLLAPWER